MAKFNEAVDKTLSFEGQYHNGAGDYGGETKWGIAKKHHPELDIKNLTVEEAKAIYKRDYWDKLRGDKIQNQKVANELFDTAVNMGWRRAGKFLQETLNLLSEHHLVEDGLVGSKTLAVLHSYLVLRPYNERVLIIALDGLQFIHYWDQAKRDPNQRRWLAGWLNQRIRNEEV
jgi:lysozyme family protein